MLDHDDRSYTVLTHYRLRYLDWLSRKTLEFRAVWETMQ
jgi:hypothetical protein